jgi:hypothetical protein
MNYSALKLHNKWISKAWLIFFILQLLALPVLATTVADLELVSNERRYDSAYNPIMSKVSPDFKLGKGIITVTYEISSYPGTGVNRGWGRVDEATYTPYFYPKDRITTPESGAVEGQPYKEVTTAEFTQSPGDILFHAWLVAPAIPDSFQAGNTGVQVPAKQKLTIEFQSTDGIDSGNNPADTSNDYGNDLPEAFIDYGTGLADISGRWNSNIGFVYDIQQSGDSFEWQVISPISEQGQGTINGNEAYAEWSGDNGSGSGSAMVEYSGERAVRISWDNGVVFTRELDA